MLYRIRDPKTGEYARGSLPGPTGKMYFSRHGKVWVSNGAIAGHLALLSDPLKYYKECDIIVIDEEAQTFTEYPFGVWYDEYSKKKAKKGK